ncbi:MAG: GyrI-like domain-containing protein [Candidatus Aminicenantales bacterium]|jgi:effector-binding domain-containing protein
MKKNLFILWLALAGAGLVLAGTPLISLARPGGPTPRQSQEPFASMKETAPFTYCSIAHKGPLTDISAVIGQLMQAMQGQSLFASVRGPMIGIYDNTPGKVKPEDLSWEVGFQVAEQASPQAPLTKKTWNYPAVAAAVHTGPYAKTGETIQRLMDWIKAQGLTAAGPILERYLNNPMQVKPEELRTEIWIPVRKK